MSEILKMDTDVIADVVVNDKKKIKRMFSWTADDGT